MIKHCRVLLNSFSTDDLMMFITVSKPLRYREHYMVENLEILQRRSHSRCKECLQLTLKINCRGQCAASYSPSVTSCILCEVVMDTHWFDHTVLYSTTHRANNNKPAEFKQSLIKLHIFFLYNKDIFLLQLHWMPDRIMTQKCALEGFSWAVTGEA